VWVCVCMIYKLAQNTNFKTFFLSIAAKNKNIKYKSSKIINSYNIKVDFPIPKKINYGDKSK